MQNNRKRLIFKRMEILQVIHFCSDIYIPACSDPSSNIYIMSWNTFIPSSGTFGFYIWVQVDVFEALFPQHKGSSHG